VATVPAGATVATILPGVLWDAGVVFYRQTGRQIDRRRKAK